MKGRLVARLLFRLGQHASQRAARYILGWVAILAVAAGSFLAFGGTLADSFDIPGTETSRVTEQIATELEGAGGATATVVFASADGGELTAEQQAEISAVLEEARSLDGVASVIDPFVTETERAAQAEQLAQGRAQIDQLPADQQAAAGAAQIDAGERLLNAASELRTISQDGSTALGMLVFDTDALDLSAEVKEGAAAMLDAASI